MLRKIILYLLITISIVASHVCCSATEQKKEALRMEDNKYIKLTMTIDELKSMKCLTFVPFPENKVKHQINDNNIRLYYKYKPLMSMAMREIDLNSYFELIFKNNILIDINQYDLKGKFIKKHEKIFCVQE
jgi:hypothetical protein